MGCTELTPKQALFTRTRGDDWVWSWTITGDVSAWDEGTLLIQIREGTTEDGALIATTGTPPTGVGAITTTGTDIGALTLAWRVDRAVTSDITAGGVYTIEAQIEIGGNITTILRERLTVTPQSAVAV